MNKRTYKTLENHAAAMMGDSAHDMQHIYRVLFQAMNIAKSYPEVNQDILIASCLLHDIGRQAQFRNPALCHAVEGGKMAYAFLRELEWNERDCIHVRDCITSHRFRTDSQPESIEAKILFDADKLDVTGALGIARTLLYEGQVGSPLYLTDESNRILDTYDPDSPESFLREYHVKLIRLYDQFYTKEARSLTQERKKLMEAFYDELMKEITLQDLDNMLDL